jgi:hypothetical protein
MNSPRWSPKNPLSAVLKGHEFTRAGKGNKNAGLSPCGMVFPELHSAQ